jgi:hypothetical protein
MLVEPHARECNATRSSVDRRESSRPDQRSREPATRAIARIMLALASSDEEITDRVFPGEGLQRPARAARGLGWRTAPLLPPEPTRQRWSEGNADEMTV